MAGNAGSRPTSHHFQADPTTTQRNPAARPLIEFQPVYVIIWDPRHPHFREKITIMLGESDARLASPTVAAAWHPSSCIYL